MTTNRLWILGAADPEMTAIEKLLTACGEKLEYATFDGVRVNVGNAYKADDVAGTHFVECQPFSGYPEGAVIIDHHREGDPGFGRPATEFLAASSIGQVIGILGQVADYPRHWKRIAVSRHPHWCGAIECSDGVWVVRTTGGDGAPGQGDNEATAAVIPMDIVYTAAADHSLGAAYRGECPGVDPDALMKWRVASRAAFQGRSEEDIMADIQSAMEELRNSDDLHICVGPAGGNDYDYVQLADMRREFPIPELPEAACRLDMAYISGPLIGLDGRHKYTCSGRPTHIHAFMLWGPANGLTDMYGDPARGFAGGYVGDVHAKGHMREN